MKKTVFSFMLIVHPLFANALASQYQPASLRDQCLDKIVHYLQHDSRYHAALLSHVPLDAVPLLLEKITRQLCTSRKIATLPWPGKFSPDGTKVLVDTSDNEPLKVYESSTGTHVLTLEDSFTSNGKEESFTNKRFIPIKWSSTGKYIYASFKVPHKESDQNTYLYKVWDSATGKKLYQIPFCPCGKLYFSPNDRFLLSKVTNKPLEVYNGATGVHMATLGPKTHRYTRWPHDPQNQWLTAYSLEHDTQLYDTQSLALAQQLPGYLECFSNDGNLIAVEACEDTGQTQEWGGIFGTTTRKITKPYACIYNRRFEKLSKIPLKFSFIRTAITPCNQFLITYNSDQEIRYLIATQEESKKLEHDYNSTAPITFSSFMGDAIIKLEEMDETTDITIERDGARIKLTCPKPINKISYTENNSLIELLNFQTRRYFLNIKIGALIPCNLKLKKVIFNFKLSSALAQGRFITKNDEHFELHQLAPVALMPCIQLLRERLKKASTH